MRCRELWASVGQKTCWVAHKLLVYILEKMVLGLCEALAFRERRKIHIAPNIFSPPLTVVAHPTSTTDILSINGT